METWQIFENECAEYLQNKYSDKGLKFIVTGGHDSNKSDIQVLKNKDTILAIECKMSAAQCGQFVLFVNEQKKEFIFSTKNKTPYDRYVEAVIKEMELKFDECNVSSKDLPISENVISQWVKNYYINVKKSRYCITRSDLGFIIFPIENMEKYFEFSAKYRIKKSGSTNPTKNNIREIEKLLNKIDVKTKIELDKSNCFAEFKYNKDKFILKGEKYRYLFVAEDAKYKIRRLSNTCNANFIVSIKLKADKQNENDLLNFEKDLVK